MKQEDDESSKRISSLKQISLLTTIPAALLAGPIIGFFAGKTLDNWFGTGPWLLIIFSILGLVASGKEVYRLIKLAALENRDDDDL